MEVASLLVPHDAPAGSFSLYLCHMLMGELCRWLFYCSCDLLDWPVNSNTALCKGQVFPGADVEHSWNVCSCSHCTNRAGSHSTHEAHSFHPANEKLARCRFHCIPAIKLLTVA